MTIFRENEVLDVLESLIFDILESHAEELETNHHGDSAEPGEDPCGCSYCLDVDRAREILIANGREVSR